jgi:hypothetical protein
MDTPEVYSKELLNDIVKELKTHYYNRVMSIAHRVILREGKKEFFDKLMTKMSGNHPLPVGVARGVTPGSSATEGTGLETIGIDHPNPINKRFGVMKSLLRIKETSSELESRIFIGFPSNIQPFNPGKVLAYSINWPHSGGATPQREIRVFQDSRAKANRYLESAPIYSQPRPPSYYIPAVLFGDAQIYGRNIFRDVMIAYIRDEKPQKLKRNIRDQIKALNKTYEPSLNTFRGA